MSLSPPHTLQARPTLSSAQRRAKLRRRDQLAALLRVAKRNRHPQRAACSPRSASERLLPCKYAKEAPEMPIDATSTVLSQRPQETTGTSSRASTNSRAKRSSRLSSRERLERSPKERSPKEDSDKSLNNCSSNSSSDASSDNSRDGSDDSSDERSSSSSDNSSDESSHNVSEGDSEESSTEEDSCAKIAPPEPAFDAAFQNQEAYFDAHPSALEPTQGAPANAFEKSLQKRERSETLVGMVPHGAHQGKLYTYIKLPYGGVRVLGLLPFPPMMEPDGFELGPPRRLCVSELEGGLESAWPGDEGEQEEREGFGEMDAGSGETRFVCL